MWLVNGPSSHLNLPRSSLLAILILTCSRLFVHSFDIFWVLRRFFLFFFRPQFLIALRWFLFILSRNPLYCWLLHFYVDVHYRAWPYRLPFCCLFCVLMFLPLHEPNETSNYKLLNCIGGESNGGPLHFINSMDFLFFSTYFAGA